MTKERAKDSRRNIILLFVNELCNIDRNDGNVFTLTSLPLQFGEQASFRRRVIFVPLIKGESCPTEQFQSFGREGGLILNFWLFIFLPFPMIFYIISKFFLCLVIFQLLFAHSRLAYLLNFYHQLILSYFQLIFLYRRSE